MYYSDAKAGALMPHALEETPHGREPNAVVYFNIFCKSAMDIAVDTADGFQYVLVVLEHVSVYTWLKPCRACTAPWKSSFAGVPRFCAANLVGERQRHPLPHPRGAEPGENTGC